VSGAIGAALCCAGNGVILATLSAVGLGFLRRDAILWPVMLVSLAIPLWGFWEARTGSRCGGGVAPIS
jgi:mercuric ion transport protein